MEVKKRVLSVLVGVVSTFFKAYGAILAMVIVAIIFDVVTGIVAAKATGVPITSKKANQGFWKKVGLLLALFFGVFLDVFIPSALGVVDISVPFDFPFCLVFGCYIIFNEGISVCENIDKINPEILPVWVKRLLQGGANKINTAVESDEEKGQED